MAGPSSAPNTAPKSTIAIARGRSAGGCMSAAAVRPSSTTWAAAPVSAKPTRARTSIPDDVPAAAASEPMIPTAKPIKRTGRRPRRSMPPPAGNAVMAAAARKMAGANPASASEPPASSNVSVAAAAESSTIP